MDDLEEQEIDVDLNQSSRKELMTIDPKEIKTGAVFQKLQLIKNPIDQFIHLLKQDHKQRKPDQIRVMELLSKDFLYFDALNVKQVNQRANMHFKICSKLSFQYLRQGGVVFRQGDFADRFYIIVKGRVNIFIRAAEHDREALKLEYRRFSKTNFPINKILIFRFWIRTVRKLMNMIAFARYIFPSLRIANDENRVKITISLIPSTGPFSLFNDVYQELRKHIYQQHKIDLMYLEKVPFYFRGGYFNFTFVKKIEEGDVFGNFGLLDRRKKRNADVVCVENCIFGSLMAEDYAQTLEEVDRQRQQKKVNQIKFFLHQTPQIFTREQLKHVCNCFVKTKLFFGSLLFEEGKPIENIYLIIKGEIELYREKKGQKGQKNSIYRLAIKGPGQVLGIECLFTDPTSQYCARACNEKFVAYSIQRSTLHKIFDESFEIENYFETKYKVFNEWFQDRIVREGENKTQILRKIKKENSKVQHQKKPFLIRSSQSEINELLEFHKKRDENFARIQQQQQPQTQQNHSQINQQQLPPQIGLSQNNPINDKSPTQQSPQYKNNQTTMIDQKKPEIKQFNASLNSKPIINPNINNNYNNNNNINSNPNEINHRPIKEQVNKILNSLDTNEGRDIVRQLYLKKKQRSKMNNQAGISFSSKTEKNVAKMRPGNATHQFIDMIKSNQITSIKKNQKEKLISMYQLFKLTKAVCNPQYQMGFKSFGRVNNQDAQPNAEAAAPYSRENNLLNRSNAISRQMSAVINSFMEGKNNNQRNNSAPSSPELKNSKRKLQIYIKDEEPNDDSQYQRLDFDGKQQQVYLDDNVDESPKVVPLIKYTTEKYNRVAEQAAGEAGGKLFKNISIRPFVMQEKDLVDEYQFYFPNQKQKQIVTSSIYTNTLPEQKMSQIFGQDREFHSIKQSELRRNVSAVLKVNQLDFEKESETRPGSKGFEIRLLNKPLRKNSPQTQFIPNNINFQPPIIKIRSPVSTKPQTPSFASQFQNFNFPTSPKQGVNIHVDQIRQQQFQKHNSVTLESTKKLGGNFSQANQIYINASSNQQSMYIVSKQDSMMVPDEKLQSSSIKNQLQLISSQGIGSNSSLRQSVLAASSSNRYLSKEKKLQQGLKSFSKI